MLLPVFAGYISQIYRAVLVFLDICTDLLFIQYNFIHSFQSVLRQVHNLFPKRVFNRMRANASSLNFQYPFFPFRSSNSCLHILPRFSVTFVLPSCIPSIMCFRRQSLRKMWPIQLTSLPFTLYRMFLSPFAGCCLKAASCKPTHNPQLHTRPATWKPQHEIPQAATTV